MIHISPLFIPMLLAAANYLPVSGFVGFVFSVIAHEAGHIFAIKLQKRSIFGITVSPFGANVECSLSSYRDDIVCAAAGPFSSFAFSCAVALFRPLFSAMPPAFFISLLLGALNLLPVSGLDGGEILSAYLSLKTGSPGPHRAEGYINAAALFMLFILSCFIFLYSGENPTMLLFCLALMMKEKQSA